MAFKFKDNANAKIMAMDFDGCMTEHNEFPKCGKPRRYAKEVVNLLHDVGVKIVIWTCRDNLQDQAPMIEWLADNEIQYDAINSSIAYAPWDYEARKIYAHMYVDDIGFGWEDTEDIMLDVMVQFLIKHLGVKPTVAYTMKNWIKDGYDVKYALLEVLEGKNNG